MSDLTHVELLWLEKRIENWIRFGRHAEEQVLDKQRRILSFAPGHLFAFVRWISNDFGTVISRIDVIRTAAYESLKGTALEDAKVYVAGTAAAFKDLREASNYDFMIAGDRKSVV